MAQKKSYSRYFIILQEDEKGYSLSSDKVASGYAKLELKNDKCKISYYVQNLKKEMAPYYMMLICNKKDVKKIIKISEMNIDDYGRADIFYEYPANNIAGSNIAMDKVSGAAIVKLIDNSIVSVMSGFASTEMPEWKKFDMIEDKNRTADAEEIEEEKIVVEEKSIFDKYEESIERSKQEQIKENIDDKEVNNKEIDDKETVENLRQDEDTEPLVQGQKEEVTETPRQDEETDIVESLDEEKIVVDNRKDEEVEKTSNDSFQSTDVEVEQFRDNTKEVVDYPRGSTAKFFRSLTEGLDETGDICEDIKRCKWYRVNVNDIQDMYDISNYNRYTAIYYPMISYYPYIRKYNHYLIGYKCDKSGEVKYLVYGVPGTKDRMEQPYRGKSGFVTWIPMRSTADLGYWLMFYDFKTSTIVVPEKK